MKELESCNKCNKGTLEIKRSFFGYYKIGCCSCNYSKFIDKKHIVIMRKNIC